MQNELFPDYYWLIEKWNGDKIRVKSDKAPYIQKLIAAGEGFIPTTTMTINVKDVKSFDKSDIPISEQLAIEAGAAQAFHAPIHETLPSGEQAIEAKWVKKSVSRRKWDSFYSGNSSYRSLEEFDNNIIIAFKVATHNIDYKKVTELSKQEILAHHL
jgi:hypothetical protein